MCIFMRMLACNNWFANELTGWLVLELVQASWEIGIEHTRYWSISLIWRLIAHKDMSSMNYSILLLVVTMQVTSELLTIQMILSLHS